MEILSSIGTFIAKAIATPLMFVLSVAGFGGANTNVGATLPSATAVFETSLASPISSSASSMTLTANSVRGGGTLSGYNCFVIDEGSAQAEFTCGTVTGTTVTSLLRGVSPTTGTTTIASLQFAHRRGSNVKISDFPLIQIIKAQNNGEETFPNKLVYTSAPTFLNNNEIVDKAYVDSVAFGSLPVSVTSGGTGASTFPSGGFLFGNGASALGASSSPTVGWLNATSTTATSTLAGFLDVTGTNSTSTFSGNVSLTATTSIKADSSNRLIANNLSYAFPSTRGASSSVLSENGSGGLTWQTPSVSVIYSNPNRNTFTTSGSTTTLLTVPIPANTINQSNRVIRFSGTYFTPIAASFCHTQIDYGNGSATSTALFLTDTSGAARSAIMIDGNITSTSTTAQLVVARGSGGDINAENITGKTSGVTSAYTLSAITYLEFRARASGGQGCGLIGATVEMVTQ